MKTQSRLAAVALAATFALPAAAQLSLPGMKQKEVDKLSKSDIGKEMLLKNGDIDKCKEEHKKKEPKVTGNLVVRFVVDTDGKPTDVQLVSTQFKGTTFATCLNDRIRGWSFSKGKQKSERYEMLQSF